MGDNIDFIMTFLKPEQPRIKKEAKEENVNEKIRDIKLEDLKQEPTASKKDVKKEINMKMEELTIEDHNMDLEIKQEIKIKRLEELKKEAKKPAAIEQHLSRKKDRKRPIKLMTDSFNWSIKNTNEDLSTGPPKRRRTPVFSKLDSMKMSKEIRHVDLIDTDSDSSNTTPNSSSETSTSTSETENEEENENLEHEDLNQEILHWMADCY